MGICFFSPPLDERGNSVKGIEFAKLLLKEYTLHRYDGLKGVITPFSNKKNILMKEGEYFVSFTIKLLQSIADDDIQ
jgi:glutaminase